jgi:stage III sporulation protein AA
MPNEFISVIDERQELFPITHDGKYCFEIGEKTDIISGCNKSQGIEIALRNMGPSIIAVDEITANEDCEALMHAGWCGVDLFATAHAASKEDLLKRPVYRSIVDSNLFANIITIDKDKSWRAERIKI